MTRGLVALLTVAAVAVVGRAGPGTTAVHPTLLFTDQPADAAVAEPPELANPPT